MIPSGRPLHWEEMHCRLVSLWDLLNMYALKAGKLIEALNWLAALMQRLAGPDGRGPAQAETCRSEVLDRMREKAEFVRATAKELEISGLATAAQRFIDDIGRARAGDPKPELATFAIPDAVTLFTHLRMLQARVADDFTDQSVLVVPLSKRDLYQPDEPKFGAQFGSDVASKFKSNGKQEVGEASNCLALGCDTACAFHLMRAVETVLEAAAVCLNLPPPRNRQDKTWGAVLTRFQDELDSRDVLTFARQWASSADRNFFRELYGTLVAIKDAWRDPTMHLERSFNDREARHLFELVKGFMQKSASRFDEDGHPLA